MSMAYCSDQRHRLQLAATLIGGVTLGMLSLFLVGEVAGGDLSGLSHLIQIAPLAALLALGWWAPQLAGALLIAIGAALAAVYLVAFERAPESTGLLLLVAALFLLPPITAGVLLLIAARR
jgi:hypothetical protein